MNAHLVEGLKELLRTGLIAAIPVVIDGLSAGVVDWHLAGVAAAIAVLRAVDKFLHENGSDQLEFKSLDALKSK